MTAATMLDELERLKIEVVAEGDRLRWRGPKGALTPALRDEIAKLKPEILTLLNATEANCRVDRPLAGEAGERRPKALELTGELIHFYNERAAILEHDAKFPRHEAERLAMVEAKASD